MALTANHHRAKAKRNGRLAIQLLRDRNPRPEWVITILFYAALHWVEAKLKDLDANYVGSTHPDRNLRVQRNIGNLYAKYRELYLKSREARYESIDMGHVPKHDLELYSRWVRQDFASL